MMAAKRFVSLALVLFVGSLLIGCPKGGKDLLKGQGGVSSQGQVAKPDEDAIRRQQAEEQIRRDRENREAARIKEQEEEEAKRLEAKANADLDRSLKREKTPGIEGEVQVSPLLKEIYFEFDKYEIRPGDAEVMKSNAALLKKYPAMKIQVEGHCDERGTREYNLALGERRANSAKKYLVALGIAPDRVSTISYGKEMPADPAHTEDAWARNRRARFVIVSK
jgi:peptidoglycan-associated lipoprotein